MTCLIAVVLCSCGNTLDERGVASVLADASGVELKQNDITSEDAYMVFLEENEYLSLVENASVFSEITGYQGYEMIVVTAKNEAAAYQIADKISRLFWWAPCDVAKKMIFANLGRTVLAVKGGDESVERTFLAYCGIYGVNNCETRQKIQEIE